MKHKNIKAFLVVSFLLALAPAFFFTSYQLFLAAKGLNILQISLVNGAFMLSVFILEVPTGAFADSFGRSRSVILGALFYSLSYIIYFFSSTLPLFVLAEIIGAFGATLISGSLVAWVIDSLSEEKIIIDLESLFKKEERFRQAGIIIGSASGAVLAGFSLALPWLFSGGVMLLASLTSIFSLPEAKRHREKFSFSLLPVTRQIKTSWQEGKNNPAFLRLSAVGAVLAISVQSLNMQWTLLFKNGFQLPQWSLGLIFALIALSITIGAHLAPWAAKKSGHEGRSLAVAFAFIGLAMLISGQTTALLSVLSFFFLHELGRGLFRPLRRASLNRRIFGSNRATMLSLDSMATHIGAVFGLLGGGWIGNHYSISIAWTVSGLLLIIISPWLWRQRF